jgi:signal transduction histidine kinase
VAHDLRTPLGTVTSGVTLLERLPREEHGTDREARVLRAVRASSRAMARIVSDLLDASRLEARRLSVAPERLDLGPLLLRLVEWAPAEAMRGHTLRLVPPGPLPKVLADPVRVEQVLANLLSNAGKYSHPQSEILLEARAGSREVTLSVTNAGAGIAARDLPRVFSRHFRTSSARSGRAPGLGLGLYIAKGLVESQGGRIWAESVPGLRTTFSFTLPLAPAEQPALARPAGLDDGPARLPV